MKDFFDDILIPEAIKTSDRLFSQLKEEFPDLETLVREYKCKEGAAPSLDEPLYNYLSKNSATLLSLEKNLQKEVICNLLDRSNINDVVWLGNSEKRLQIQTDLIRAYHGSPIYDLVKKILHRSSTDFLDKICNVLIDNKPTLELPESRSLFETYADFINCVFDKDCLLSVPSFYDIPSLSNQLLGIILKNTGNAGFLDRIPHLIEDKIRTYGVDSQKKFLIYENFIRILSHMDSPKYSPEEFISFLEKHMGGSHADLHFEYKDKMTGEIIELRRFNLFGNNKIEYGLRQLNAGDSEFKNLDDIARTLEGSYLLIESELLHPIKIIKVLGRGKYKTTYLAEYNNQRVALKRLELTEGAAKKLDERNLTIEDVYNKETEVSPLWLRHPNINPIFPIESFSSVEYNTRSLLFVETLYKETLNEFMGRFSHFSVGRDKGQAMEFAIRAPIDFLVIMPKAIEIVRGIAACHRKGIVHSDIKPDNIGIISHELPDKPRSFKEGNMEIYQAVISDFGLSSYIAEAEGIEKVRDNMGAVYTRDPELFKKGSLPSQLSDVWSLTAVMYWMLTTQYPFSPDCEDYAQIKTKQDYEKRVRLLVETGKTGEALIGNIKSAYFYRFMEKIEETNRIFDEKRPTNDYKKLVDIMFRGFRLVSDHYINAEDMRADIESKFHYPESMSPK